MVDKEWLKNITHQPGVYRMLDASGDVLYVGKARDLKKRVTSYFRPNQSVKTQSLMSQVERIELTVTTTENEALILEANLIKSIKPRYNILLRDDKSYPYIFISKNAEFPRLDIYRGSRNKPGQYFGPYPSASSAREALHFLQKCFPLRPCKDSFFANRTRPCLQYQIKRCHAPCVGLISKDSYDQLVNHAVLFLQGKNQTLIRELTAQMRQASEALKYEHAAQLRDQIQKLRSLQEQQHIVNGEADADVLAVYREEDRAVVCQLLIRHGTCLGAHHHNFKKLGEETESEILNAFITQFYLNPSHQTEIPPLLITSHEPLESDWLISVLRELSGNAIAMKQQVRGVRAQWLNMAESNAKITWQSQQSLRSNLHARFSTLNDAFQVQLGEDKSIERIECFDISHTQGELTVASCVVFNLEGPVKSDYRRYNIKDITPGDDYAAMKQVLERRYLDMKEHNGQFPDLILIDGGKGQLAQAMTVLEELQFHDVLVLGVAKGPERKAGVEQLILPDHTLLDIPSHSPARLLIQQVRDEAHRFAITGHKNRRGKARRTSTLEDIEGVGPKRRRALLAFFGGLREMQTASIEELMKVEGINRPLAEKIWQALRRS